MPLAINTIKNNTAQKKRKRVGRGNASGQGTYSGKGQKGQKSRAGVSNLKRLGMKQVLLRTPKKRGFKSGKPKAIIVNLEELNKFFKEGNIVDPKSLQSKGLIDKLDKEVKILARGELTVKKLIFSGLSLSQAAREKIDKLGGKIK